MEQHTNWKDPIYAPSSKVILTIYDDGANPPITRKLQNVNGVWFLPDLNQYVAYQPTAWDYLN